jgi:hypothetical protein
MNGAVPISKMVSFGNSFENRLFICWKESLPSPAVEMWGSKSKSGVQMGVQVGCLIGGT